MTSAEIRSARKALNLSQAGLAEVLRLGPNGERTIRRWEQGDVPVTGPASVAIELLLERDFTDTLIDKLKARLRMMNG